MNRKEIFRYSTADTDFIAFAEDIASDFTTGLNVGYCFKRPEAFKNEPIIWLDLHKTNRSAKKNKKVYRQNPDDAMYGAGMTENGLQIAYELKKQFARYLEKEKPVFLCIGAYEDKSATRFRVYHNFLIKHGYQLYYIESNMYEQSVYIYARTDVGLKAKDLKPYFLRKSNDLKINWDKALSQYWDKI